MTVLGVAQILIFFLVVLAVTKPLGAFMTRVFEGERTLLHPVLRPVERLIYRLGGVREEVDQRWTEHAASLLSFSSVQSRDPLRLAATAGVAAAPSSAAHRHHAPLL